MKLYERLQQDAPNLPQAGKMEWGIWDVARHRWAPDPLRAPVDIRPARYTSKAEAERRADRDWRALNPEDRFEVRPLDGYGENPVYPEQLAFERGLQPGDEIEARWTWGGGAYAARAQVVRVNPKSIRVRTLERVSYGGREGWGIDPGHEITLPRLSSDTWSENNGAFRPLHTSNAAGAYRIGPGEYGYGTNPEMPEHRPERALHTIEHGLRQLSGHPVEVSMGEDEDVPLAANVRGHGTNPEGPIYQQGFDAAVRSGDAEKRPKTRARMLGLSPVELRERGKPHAPIDLDRREYDEWIRGWVDGWTALAAEAGVL